MNVSPLDLRQQRFSNAFRGFDKVEVTSFLMAVADDYEQALRETDRLRQDLARMEAVAQRAPRAREEPQDDADDGSEAGRRHQGERRGRSAPDRPRGAGPIRSAAREDAGAPRGHPARDRRPEAEAPRRRDHDRIDDPDAAQHARVRARAGSARARGQDPAAPPAAAESSSEAGRPGLQDALPEIESRPSSAARVGGSGASSAPGARRTNTSIDQANGHGYWQPGTTSIGCTYDAVDEDCVASSRRIVQAALLRAARRTVVGQLHDPIARISASSDGRGDQSGLARRRP